VIDHIEQAIAELRTGPALAVADLLILHPNTWSAVRRTKDGFDRYLTQPDPTSGEAASIWGVPVLTTISCPDDTGVLLDTTKFGRVLVREPLGVRVGFANDDFTRNIVRYVGEERLTLAVERPQAVMEISALPSTAEAETTSKKRSSSKKDD
jgi:HK97 family phage major capsid protein